MNTPSMRERARGCLLGGAVGDALGAAVEFCSLTEIRHRFGPDGIADYAEAYGRRGAITDDTQMTLWTAEGLLRADNCFTTRGIASVPQVVWGSYQRWLATQGERAHSLYGDAPPDPGSAGWLMGESVLHQRRAPGNTCLSALRSGQVGTMEEPLNDSKGCGGIMRIAPVGLVSSDPFGDGCELAALTHGHPSGYLSAGAFALIIDVVFGGTSLPQAMALALQELRRHPGHEETTRAIERAGSLAFSGTTRPETVEELGEGWVAEEALAIALFCSLVAADFRSGVLLAVNHGGDSDSTGSLTGQLLGVQDGVQGIPARWLDELEGREIVEQVADDLVRHFVEPVPGSAGPLGVGWAQRDDLDRYPPN